MALTAAVDRLLGVCGRVFHVLANACLAVMLVINLVNILVRGLTGKGILWVFPWTTVIFVWATFLGFFVLYQARRDITVDIIVDRLGPGWRLAARLLVNAIVLVLMAVMLWHAPRVLAQQVSPIEMVFLPRYVLSAPLFVSCALIFVSFVVDTAGALGGGREPRPDPAGGG